ncbi:PREDICTED: probable disease resistance protein At4g27220 [Ipomoea nil]|uniref:probable disease resistance protein At4g27220 n=1 Tax=Ipomoea nil TaxID=35883 RepID=UPI000900AEEC|nr:PREDICTED: probable disease resistance protein At4g27220 [Ipomoea nil]
MEAVAGIIGSALTEPFKVLFGSIYAAMKNRFKIHSNYKHLERDITLVLDLKTHLRRGLNDEQLQHLLPTAQVEDWLRKVEELENNFNSLRSTVTECGITSDSASCCSGSLHCKLSNDIAKQIVKAKQLIEEGKPFEDKIVGIPVARPVQYIAVTSIEDQPTASRNLAKMMDLLKSKEYKRIGVWGMGGVGKTTLVKNLNNQLTKDPTFNIVIWVVVSRNATVENVQSKIAERLHIMNREVSMESMASRLCNKLEGQRFLLILDDIWEEIDLNAVGIPRHNEDTGSKIILTTRDFNVCQRMSTDIDFQIGRLHPEEAWKLFRETVEEEVVDDDQIKPMAEAIVEECDGLPLALIMVGASLRKKREIGLWKCALNALQKSEPSHIRGVEEKVYKPLKWSYDSLQGQQLKSCFLFFCLFPEDFEIHTGQQLLAQYWVAEGLIDEQQNFEEQQNEALRIVDYLKDSCLLERGHRVNHVKMHDVVRDVGVWIAKSLEEGCKAIIKAGISGTQISQQLFNCSGGVKRVSFMESNIEFLPNCNIQCAEASTLFLQGNQTLLEVPNTFLQGFQMLRILDLSDTKIKLLPHSLLQLGELRALLLKNCCEMFELPSLATLGMLQVLNCSGSAITKLPEDFEKLTNLRQLDLSRTDKLRNISSEKVSNLCSLEFLCMTGSAIKWRMRKVNDEDVLFEKLLCLDQLLSFHIDLEDISHTTAEHVSWLRRINSFCVNVIHDHNRSMGTYLHNTKHVFFTDFVFSGDESIGWLLVHAFDCAISYCKGVDLMLDNMVRSSVTLGPFLNLKTLLIAGCCISVKRSSQGCVSECDLLPNLEELHFYELTELESISDCSNFLGLRFTKLRSITVYDCYQLENLFTMDGTLHELANLESIWIHNCKNLSQVFKNTSTDNFVPMLKSLDLDRLPALEEICKADESWKSLKHLRVRECSMLLKFPLSVQTAENIQSIRGEQNWWNQLQWDNENLKMHLHPHFKPWD